MLDVAYVETGIDAAIHETVEHIVGEHQPGLQLEERQGRAQAAQQAVQAREVGIADAGNGQVSGNFPLELTGLA